MPAGPDESSTTTYAANYSSSSDAGRASTSPTSTIPESRGRNKRLTIEKSAAGVAAVGSNTRLLLLPHYILPSTDSSYAFGPSTFRADWRDPRRLTYPRCRRPHDPKIFSPLWQGHRAVRHPLHQRAADKPGCRGGGKGSRGSRGADRHRGPAQGGKDSAVPAAHYPGQGKRAPAVVQRCLTGRPSRKGALTKVLAHRLGQPGRDFSRAPVREPPCSIRMFRVLVISDVRAIGPIDALHHVSCVYSTCTERNAGKLGCTETVLSQLSEARVRGRAVGSTSSS